MPAQRGIILHSHVDTATLTFSRELSVYKHHLRLTLVPWISLRNVSDLLLLCRCAMWHQATAIGSHAKPLMSRSSWKGISLFHLLMGLKGLKNTPPKVTRLSCPGMFPGRSEPGQLQSLVEGENKELLFKPRGQNDLKERGRKRAPVWRPETGLIHWITARIAMNGRRKLFLRLPKM